MYIGGLGDGAAKQELEDIFGNYGHVRDVWIARNPPGSNTIFLNVCDAYHLTRCQ